MKKIVILGGGYSGVHAAKILNKAFKRDKDVSITLIDKNPYHTLMTELHEVAGNRVSEDSVRISYDRIFTKSSVNVVLDRITALDTEKQELKSDTQTYSYDYLMVAVGAEPTDFGIPGVKEHSLPLWSYDDALRIKDHIIEKFAEAAHEKDEAARRKMLTFAVAGAGFTGIEMVGELIEWFPLLCEEYGINPDEYSLINVEGLCQILNMIPERPRNKAYRYMEKHGVRFILDSFISEAKEGSFTLEDGTVIDCGTLIWTCGVKGKKQARNWGLKVVQIDRIRVDETMKVEEQNNIWAAGDCQWFMEEDKPLPQIVEAAEQTAETAAENIIRAIKGKGEPVVFKSKFHGFMVSIGGRYAVSHNMGVSLSWIPAMAVKHFVNCLYLHSVCGVNGWAKYLRHEIFHIKNKRSLLGGLIAGHLQGLWAVPLRMWLGVVWLFEGLNKIGEGWLNKSKGSSSSWMFSQGVVQRGMPGYGGGGGEEAVSGASDGSWSAAGDTAADTVTAASDAAWSGAGDAAGAAADTVTAASSAGMDAAQAAADSVTAASGAGDAAAHTANQVADGVREWGPWWNLDNSIFQWDGKLVTWFREIFMDGIAAHLPYFLFQVMIVGVEVLIGLLLLGGLFTFPAAGVSIIMCFVFILSGMFSWSKLWFIFAAFLMLGGAGRTLGLDYWVMPWLGRFWRGTGIAQSTHLYGGEPHFRKNRRKSGKKGK